MNKITSHNIDEFIKDVDSSELPIPEAISRRWSDFQYFPDFTVDIDADPYGDFYMNNMLSLYEEITGHKYSTVEHELTDFDFEKHLSSPTPYGDPSPSDLGLHFERLSRAIRVANIPRFGRVLDMGSGWGLSSEFLAHFGFDVTSVDINNKFVDLVNARSAKLNLEIEAVVSDFEDFQTDELFDAVFFYECFHHSLRPWILIEKMARFLNPGGKIVLVGEPVQNCWWKTWGLRLDPLSIYCIRKFGWFESGWSKKFLVDLFSRAGLFLREISHNESLVGDIYIGEMLNNGLTAIDIIPYVNLAEWYFDGVYLASKGGGSISLNIPATVDFISFVIFNFRGRSLLITVRSDDVVKEFVLNVGEQIVDFPIKPGCKEIQISGDVWCPCHELKSEDSRWISFHLNKILFRRS